MLFAYPKYLWFLLILVPYIAWYVYHHRADFAAMSVSTTRPYDRLPRTYKEYLLHGMFLLRLVAVAMLIIILKPSSAYVLALASVIPRHADCQDSMCYQTN